MWLIYLCLGIIILFNVLSAVTRRFRDPYRDIYFVMGKPGSGKSTYFVNRIQYYLKQNKRLAKKGLKQWAIYSDTPINIPGVRYFNPKDLATMFPEKKSVIFIDEISLVWDARKFKKFDEGVSEFFKLHRHAECIIYCASQSFDCDKRIRDLCTHFLIVKNFFGCICLIRPVLTIFPIFTKPDSDKGSDITSGYEWDKIWNWKLTWMPKSFKFFNTKSLPFRPELEYSYVETLAKKYEDKSAQASAEVQGFQPGG